MSKTSAGAGFRLPIELPPQEYSEQYFQRLVNQLRIVLGLIPAANDVESEANNRAWFLS